MKKVTSELVNIFWQDGQKVGMLYQNSHIEMYTLKKANKQDVAALLETEITPQNNDKKVQRAEG